MLLLSLFHQTWKVLWKNPALWVFGLFLAILGQGGVSEVVLRAISTFYRSPRGAQVFDVVLERDFWMIGSFTRADLPMTLLKGVGGLVALVGILLSMAAIPLAVVALEKRRRALKIPELLRDALANFWKVFGVFILSSAAFILLLVPLVLVLRASTDPSIRANVGSGMLVALLAGASAVVFFLALYATNAIVLGGLSLGHGIANAWNIFRRHWVMSVECGLVFFLLNILAAQVTDALIRPILAIAYLLTLFLIGRGYSTVAYVMFILLGVVLVTIVWVLLVSFYAAFQTIFWTVLYRQLSIRMTFPSRLHLFTALKGAPQAVGT